MLKAKKSVEEEGERESEVSRIAKENKGTFTIE